MAVRKILSTAALGGLAVTALCATGFAAATNSEAVVREAFSVALNANQAPRSTVAKTVATSGPLSVPVAGTEEYWLTAMRPEGGLPLTKTVSVGDRMALSFGGKNIQLEVADVSEFAPKVHRNRYPQCADPLRPRHRPRYRQHRRSARPLCDGSRAGPCR